MCIRFWPERYYLKMLIEYMPIYCQNYHNSFLLIYIINNKLKKKVNHWWKNGNKEEIIWGRSIKWCKKKHKLQAYNTIINVYNLCETSSWFDFVWFVQILIDLHSKILNVKKVQIPESTMSNSIFNFIEVSDNEQLHTSILWKHKKREPSCNLTTYIIVSAILSAKLEPFKCADSWKCICPQCPKLQCWKQGEPIPISILRNI